MNNYLRKKSSYLKEKMYNVKRYSFMGVKNICIGKIVLFYIYHFNEYKRNTQMKINI